MKIVKVFQTCYACPSQWDAWDENGNYWYLRFRHGFGEATQYPSPNVDDWDDRPPNLEFKDSCGNDGIIELKLFCDQAGLELTEELTVDSVYNYWPYTDLEAGP